MREFVFFYFLIFYSNLFGQLTNDGGVLHIESGATVYSDANIILKNSATTTNEGTLKTTNNLQNNSSSTLNGNGQYFIQTDWTNAATFTKGTSKVIFYNSGNSNLTSGGGEFYDIELNKSSGNTLTLTDNVSISNNLNFSADNNQILIGLNNLTFGSSGTITSFDANEYIITGSTGQVIKNSLSNFTFPVGFNSLTYNPITIAESGTSDNIGVRCLENVLENGSSGNALTEKFIDASWILTEGTSGVSNLTLTAQWAASDELTNFDRTNSGMAFYSGSGWQLFSQSNASGSDPYTQTRSGISAVGVFSVSSDNSVFPLDLLGFEVRKLNETDALLKWETDSEIQVSHFEIERSSDLIEWEYIDKTDAKNEVSEKLNYQYLDKNVGLNPAEKSVFYYRLKIVDSDGSFEYSPVRSVFFENNFFVNIYPNPSQGRVFLRLNSEFLAGNLELKITDIFGKEVYAGRINSDLSEWNFRNLNGIFWFRITEEERLIFTARVVLLN